MAGGYSGCESDEGEGHHERPRPGDQDISVVKMAEL